MLEIVWVVVGLISSAAGLNMLFSGNWKRSLVFFLMAFVSFGFARYRHFQRKKH